MDSDCGEINAPNTRWRPVKIPLKPFHAQQELHLRDQGSSTIIHCGMDSTHYVYTIHLALITVEERDGEISTNIPAKASQHIAGPQMRSTSLTLPAAANP